MPHPWEFIHDEIGYNYRMPNINAALGLSQLEQLPEFLNIKRQISDSYKQFFKELNTSSSGCPSAEFIEEPHNSKSNYWLNCILLESKLKCDHFLKSTNEAGIMTRPAWRIMNELAMFKDCETDGLENARWIADRLVNIPSGVISTDTYK